MREYKIALAVIKQDNNYLMQRRGNHPRVGAAGLIGFFGGKIEKDEDTTKALCREIAEETTLSPMPEGLKQLGSVSIEMDHVDGRARVDAEAFELSVLANTKVEAQEWELIVMPIDTVKSRIDELTPATKAVFEEIIWR